MSLAQQLLLRALVARFWQKPYEQRLVRWGTEIHDRWMLPHFVAQDFRDVIEDLLQRAGYPLDPGWFATHLEFRFPLYDEIAHQGIHGVELPSGARTVARAWGRIRRGRRGALR